MTLKNPTKARPRKGDKAPVPTVEAEAWPELADILSLVKAGIPYEEALEMSPLECSKTLAIFSAWAIPSDRRIGGSVMASKSMIDALYG